MVRWTLSEKEVSKLTVCTLWKKKWASSPLYALCERERGGGQTRSMQSVKGLRVRGGGQTHGIHLVKGKEEVGRFTICTLWKGKKEWANPLYALCERCARVFTVSVSITAQLTERNQQRVSKILKKVYVPYTGYEWRIDLIINNTAIPETGAKFLVAVPCANPCYARAAGLLGRNLRA